MSDPDWSVQRVWEADQSERRDLHLVRSAFDESRTLVNGDRSADYGPPAENMERTAAIWSGILGVPITPRLVALCLVGLKLAREGYKHTRDNLVDAHGYLLCAEECVERD